MKMEFVKKLMRGENSIMNKYEIHAHDKNFSLTIEILADSITRASEIAKDAL